MKLKKKRDVVLDSLVHEVQNDLKLVDLDLFGNVIKKIVDSMRNEFLSFSKFYERIILSQEVQEPTSLLDHVTSPTPTPLLRASRVSVQIPKTSMNMQ